MKDLVTDFRRPNWNSTRKPNTERKREERRNVQREEVTVPLASKLAVAPPVAPYFRDKRRNEGRYLARSVDSAQ